MSDTLDVYSLSPLSESSSFSTFCLKDFPGSTEPVRDQVSLLFLNEEQYVHGMGEVEHRFSDPCFVILCRDLKLERIYKYSEDKRVLRILPASELLKHEDSIKRAFLSLKSRKEQVDNIFDKVRLQNKKLREMNDGLEQVVEQRTIHLQRTTEELQKQTKQIRDLIQFIKSLAQVSGLDDLMFLLRQSFIKFHKLGSPMLVYSTQSKEVRILYFQGQQLIDTRTGLEPSEVQSVSPESLQQHLARELGRPIGTLLPFSISSASNFGRLIFEHNMDPLEQSVFEERMKKRYSSVKVCFEQTLLKMKSKELSKQWSSTFDSLTDPIAIVDSEYEVIRSNQSFSARSMKQCHEIFVSLSKEKSEPHKGTISVEDKIFEVNSYPIYLEGQSRLSNMIVHYSDITLATSLKSQLIQSEKMSAIGLLAGNIAHELNNPLTGIKSLADLLMLDLKKEDDIFQDLQEVKVAAERCEKIIKNLLEFSSVKQNQEEVVSVKATVEKTLPFLKTAMHIHRSSIALSDEFDAVQIEPHLLQQVIFNLVNNACQAMTDVGELELTTRVEQGGVIVSVKDNGPGVPDSIKRVIFDPFFTTKKEGEGTGLGLSLSRSIIEKYGGRLLLVEIDRPGACFEICLPLKSESP